MEVNKKFHLILLTQSVNILVNALPNLFSVMNSFFKTTEGNIAFKTSDAQQYPGSIQSEPLGLG